MSELIQVGVFLAFCVTIFVVLFLVAHHSSKNEMYLDSTKAYEYLKHTRPSRVVYAYEAGEDINAGGMVVVGADNKVYKVKNMEKNSDEKKQKSITKQYLD